MRRAPRGGTLLAGLVAGAMAAGLGGCTDYVMETTVNPDGSGVRMERVEVGDNENVRVSEADYMALMHFGTANGWSRPAPGVNANADSVRVIQRRMDVPDLASWSRISGSFRIDGAIPSRARERVGYVTLGNVRFRNEVRVTRGQTSDGATTLSYRELFQAHEVMDAVAEFLVSVVDRSVAGRYPRLTGEERGQIVGAFRSRLWTAIRNGLLSCSGDCDDEEELVALARDVAVPGARIVANRYPGDHVQALTELIGESLDDDGTRDFGTVLPGVELSWNSHIVFRLNLPGEITESNADRVEDGTLVWEFGPDDAIEGPVEIRAASLVQGR